MNVAGRIEEYIKEIKAIRYNADKPEHAMREFLVYSRKIQTELLTAETLYNRLKRLRDLDRLLEGYLNTPVKKKGDERPTSLFEGVRRELVVRQSDISAIINSLAIPAQGKASKTAL